MSQATTREAQLQVLLSEGPARLMRSELALQTALAAASCGTEVTLFLTQAASIWGCRKALEGEAGRLQDLLGTLLSLGVRIECCSTCAEKACAPAPDGVDEWGGLRDGITPVGMVTFASRAARGCPTLTF
ncbi:MAG: DsrE family protein [Planctomycetes bacterium]|nr:DsrE family protein [Planctomycetota bacterium]